MYDTWDQCCQGMRKICSDDQKMKYDKIKFSSRWKCALQWRHNERDRVSNHRRLDCLLLPFVQSQIKENIKAPCHWPLWGEFTGDSEFPAQRASNAENVPILCCHHGMKIIWWNGPRTFRQTNLSKVDLPWHRENSPVTQTTPEPTRLSWEGWPREKYPTHPPPHPTPPYPPLVTLPNPVLSLLSGHQLLILYGYP